MLLSDLIWFNNLEVYKTPNYEVQKLFSNNAGTDVLSITENGNALIGQQELYASAVKDSNSSELIIKIVNTSDKAKTISILENLNSMKGVGTMSTLQSDDLSVSNSFKNPNSISIKVSSFQIEDGKIELLLAAQSVNLIKLKI